MSAAPGSADHLFVHPALYVARCDYGWGVFTREFIPRDTIIEECHFIRYRREHVQSPHLHDYVYELSVKNEAGEDEPGWHALVLGYGSIYNHASDNNTYYLFDESKHCFIYQTLRDLQPGEQIFISYGEKWWETRNGHPETPPAGTAPAA